MDIGLTIHTVLLGGLGGYIVGATIVDPKFATDGLRGIWDAWVRIFRAIIGR